MSLKEKFIAEYHARMNRPCIADMVREGYSKWVTIGGNKSAPEGSRGGTPVQLDGSGNIISGPKSLAGHHVGSIPSKKDLLGRESKGGSQQRLFGPKDTVESGRPSTADRYKWGDSVQHKPDGHLSSIP